MGAAIVIWLIGLVIFFSVLHYVIRSAVDSSRLSRNVQELRDFLLKRQPERSGFPPFHPGRPAEPEEACPGCGRAVREEDNYCPGCGLKLRED